MIAYINNLESFKKDARKLGFHDYEDVKNPEHNAFSKSIFRFDNFPIRIRIKVYKSSGKIEVKAFKFCGTYFKELPKYLRWNDVENYLKSIEKYIVWRNI